MTRDVWGYIAFAVFVVLMFALWLYAFGGNIVMPDVDPRAVATVAN